MPANVCDEVDVGRFHRVQAGGQRDVLESVRRPDAVDLGTEGAPLGERAGRIERGRHGPLRARALVARFERGDGAWFGC